jgi:hypothetical protein
MVIGSIGLDTRLFFLKEFELAVVLKPCEPPVVVMTLLAALGLYALPGILKSEEWVNCPKLSVPDDIIACF